MLSSKTLLTPAIVLKRTKSGEADWIITVFTKELGKLTAVSRGARKLQASQRGNLEPGNILSAHFVATKSLPILTQSAITHDLGNARSSIAGIRQLVQILEVYDALLVEGDSDESAFELLSLTLQKLASCEKGESRSLKLLLKEFVNSRGFEQVTDDQISLLSFVSTITEKPMKSWEFLQIKQ